jgi:hypothetical protein
VKSVTVWGVQRLAGRKVFTAGKREYSWDDVVLAAHLWGAHAALERAVREELACKKHLATLGEWAREPDVEDEAADAWRYDRNLLAADDLNAWLDDRGLDEDAWSDYIERSVLRAQWSGEMDEITRANRVTPAEVTEAMYVDAVCSGALERWAEDLAGRAAVYERLVGAKKTPPCSKTRVRSVLKRVPRDVAGDREHIGCLEVVYADFTAGLATPDALDHEIEGHVLDWTIFDCTSVYFGSASAAREAALLVREDGLPLAEAASMAKAFVQRTRYVLEDADAALRDRLTASRAGEVIGPLAIDGRPALIGVVKRVEPSKKQAAVRKRAQERVIRRTIQREVTGRVAWHERF